MTSRLYKNLSEGGGQFAREVKGADLLTPLLLVLRGEGEGEEEASRNTP